MAHYQFIFETIPEEKKDVLIALLDDMGFNGFEEEGNQLKAFIRIDRFKEDLFDKIIEQNELIYLRSIIKETNWNALWESGFEPILVNHPLTHLPFASVRANFHEAPHNVLYDLLITPKMSFGTGHHATTWLMIQQMSLIDFKGKEVIDFGTGTAVLAILAEKMGASKITAIDHDEWSITNALENIAANNCTRIDLVNAGAIESNVKADIILANINLNVIIANLDAIRKTCNSPAILLFSGILLQDKDQIFADLKAHNFLIKDYFTRDNWLVILTIGE